MRYWPKYNLIWEIDQCELSYEGEDSGGGEDLESSGESVGANNTTISTNTHGNSLHVDDGSNSESSTGGDKDETPTSSPASTAAKTFNLALPHLQRRYDLLRLPLTRMRAQWPRKLASERRILKKTSAYKMDEM
ncbi:MAG: hypothetical protein L6R42_008328 [Xanthoria sp. 1 TBL-2021]|nr:MAG: hypothetical protein L6R42_008328 [Xanthoria sp. 1 TBL-2021]